MCLGLSIWTRACIAHHKCDPQLCLRCQMRHLTHLYSAVPLAHPHRQRLFWAGLVLAQLAVPHSVRSHQPSFTQSNIVNCPPEHTHSSTGRCTATLAATGSGQPDMLSRPTPAPAGPGQESVWSYPRPAVAQPASATLRVEYNGKTIAETTKGFRTIETSHPPTYVLSHPGRTHAAGGKTPQEKEHHEIHDHADRQLCGP